MRKITSKRKEEKKKKRNQLIVGLALVLILFASIFGYSFSRSNSEENKITYNGYEFIEKNGFWIVEIENSEFSFRYNPNEIETIDSELKSINNYYDKPLYISSDDIESSSEIYRNLESIIQRMQLACLDGEVCEDEELPVKTCEDNFITIKEADATEIVQDNNCVFIRGKLEDLAKITDGFLLKIIGI